MVNRILLLQTRLMNQKKLKYGIIDPAGPRIYTGTLDCFIQVRICHEVPVIIIHNHISKRILFLCICLVILSIISLSVGIG